jgi:predicted phage tail protein
MMSLRPRLSGKKKALMFPVWLEALVIVAALGMAVVEWLHADWAWAVIFGVSGAAFGIGLLVRMIAGDKHGGA